jgi:UDP-glucose 4-epimerase
MKMKKILVTGSSGYIGRHLLDVLPNYYTVGLDRVFKPQSADKFIFQDILEGKCVEGEFDAVVHLAGLVNVGDSVKWPMRYYETNVAGTLKMLEHVDYKHFIFASTGAAENPNSPYATSKRVTEDLVRQYCQLNNKDCTIFRFYNVIGSAGYDPTNMDGLMYNLIKAGMETGVFNIYGDDYDTYDGTALRDYIHVSEVCQAIKSAIEVPSDGTIQNLATGSGYSVLQMIDYFKEVNNMQFEVNVLPRRPGDLARSVLGEVSPYMVELFRIDEKLKVI